MNWQGRLSMIIVALAALVFIIGALSVQAEYRFQGPGWGGQGFVANSASTVEFSVSSDSIITVLVMNADNKTKFDLNQSFVCIQDLTKRNVTEAHLEGQVPPGSYWILVFNPSNDFAAITDPTVTPLPSENPMTLLFIVAASIIIVASTITILRRRH